MKKTMVLIVSVLILVSVTIFIVKQNNDKRANAQYAAENGNDIDNSQSVDPTSYDEIDSTNKGLITIQALDVNSNEPISGAQVRLISKSTGDDFIRTITDGYLEEELPEGDYLLTEYVAADGYNRDGSVQNFSVVKDEPRTIVLKRTRDESNVSGGTDLAFADTQLEADKIPLSAVDIDHESDFDNSDFGDEFSTENISTQDDSFSYDDQTSKAESNPKTSDNSSTFKFALLLAGAVYFVLFGILRYYKKNIKQI